MYSSRDNWERLVRAVVRKQQIWELFHSHSRSPSISTIASSDDDDDHSNEQFLDNRWAATTSTSTSPPPFNNPPSAIQVIGNKSGEAITRKLFPASWYRAKEIKQEYRIFNIPVIGNKSGEAITRKLFPASWYSWYRAKQTRQEHHITELPGVRTFSLNELKIATNNFVDTNILFRYGYSKWYKGLLENGFIVAVKRFEHMKKNISFFPAEYFLAEVETIAIAVAHPNLLRPIGGCFTQKEKLFVYPYMVNGTVASCLRERSESQPPLDWSVRKRIAFGAARGLAYLHGGCERKIIHRDVQAANIYLNEEFDAIIGNFELTIHMDHGVTHVEDLVCGTLGHIAPEYFSESTLSEKSDVFAYGIFLLELITGHRAYDRARLDNDEDVMLLDWVKKYLNEKKWERIFDPDIGGNNYYVEEEVKQLIRIALRCTHNEPERRPNMSELVRIMLGHGDDLFLAQRWEEFCDEEIIPDSPRQSDEISSPR